MNSYRILIVDDDEHILNAIKRILYDEEYEIFTAKSGKEGLDLVKSNDFQMIISDYRMKEMDGIEFLKSVNKVSPKTVRILLTGYVDVSVTIPAINEGHIYKFLVKPWNEFDLKLQIRKSLEYFDLIGERERLHEQLKIKNEELEDINKNLQCLVEERTQQLLHAEKLATLGQIASQIGHEINNTLSVLKGRLQLLQRAENANNDMQLNYKILARELDKLAIHGRNLLSFGKPVPPEYKIVNVSEIVENSFQNLWFSGILKYYDLKKDYPDDIPRILCDARQLEQVFTNLFINAHHAMDDKGTLSISIKMSEDGQYIEIVICDTGHGIREGQFEKIFEPFYTTKPEGKGTGLGLSVVKNIIDAHHGYVRIESKVNIGTKVIVGLPSQLNGDVISSRGVHK